MCKLQWQHLLGCFSRDEHGAGLGGPSCGAGQHGESQPGVLARCHLAFMENTRLKPLSARSRFLSNRPRKGRRQGPAPNLSPRRLHCQGQGSQVPEDQASTGHRAMTQLKVPSLCSLSRHCPHSPAHPPPLYARAAHTHCLFLSSSCKAFPCKQERHSPPCKNINDIPGPGVTA